MSNSSCCNLTIPAILPWSQWQYLCDHSSAHGSRSIPQSEPLSLFQDHGVLQYEIKADVLTWHHHFLHQTREGMKRWQPTLRPPQLQEMCPSRNIEIMPIDKPHYSAVITHKKLVGKSVIQTFPSGNSMRQVIFHVNENIIGMNLDTKDP